MWIAASPDRSRFQAPAPTMPVNISPSAGMNTTPSAMRPSRTRPMLTDELVLSRGELARAVQRIDQPECRRRRGDAPGGDLLLGDHRKLGRGAAQAGDDDRLGGAVGLGDRGEVFLALHGEAARADREDRGAGLFGEARGERQQGMVVHRPVIPVGRGGGNARRRVR